MPLIYLIMLPYNHAIAERAFATPLTDSKIMFGNTQAETHMTEKVPIVPGLPE